MAIQTIDGFEIKAPLSIDNRYGPFADITEANDVILSFYRYIGLTVLLTGSGTQIEYWYNPTIADEDLVPKGAALSISGSDGQVVFFSGSTALSGSPSFIFNYTSSTPTFNVSGAISASYGPGTVGFYGTASWALNALTASFITGTGVFGPFGSNSVLSASYALHGGDVTKIIAGTNITIDPPEGTGSVTINASAAAGAGVSVTATASFTNLSTWNFTHNLLSRYVIIQALDVNHNQIIPENITLVDSSSAVLTFPTPESGYAVASIGGVTSSFSLTSSAVITNFGGQIYDLNNNLVIQPTDILIISGNMSVNGSAIISGNLVPGGPYSANISNYNIGTSTTRWNNLYVGNQIYLGTLGDSAYIDYNNGHIISDKPFSGSFTGSFFGIGPSLFSGSITLTGSLNVTGSTTQTGNNTLIGNTILSGSIGISGSSTIQGTTTMSGSLSISGSTTQTGNNTLIGNTILSGSINISGSTTLSGSTNFSGTHILSGSNTIIGNTVLSGSIDVSGSSNFHNSIFIITGSTFIKGVTNISGSTNITGSFNVVNGDINVVSGSSFTRWGNKLFNYGQFSSIQTQSGSADTAYSMVFDTIDFSNGVTLVDNSKITIANTGLYNIQFSAQLHTTVNQAVNFSIWFAMTGSNIANSNTDFTVEKISGGGYGVAALNFLTEITSGSYVELKYSKTTLEGQLEAKGTQSTPTRPATPSIIATVTQVA